MMLKFDRRHSTHNSPPIMGRLVSHFSADASVGGTGGKSEVGFLAPTRLMASLQHLASLTAENHSTTPEIGIWDLGFRVEGANHKKLCFVQGESSAGRHSFMDSNLAPGNFALGFLRILIFYLGTCSGLPLAGHPLGQGPGRGQTTGRCRPRRAKQRASWTRLSPWWQPGLGLGFRV